MYILLEGALDKLAEGHYFNSLHSFWGQTKQQTFFDSGRARTFLVS